MYEGNLSPNRGESGISTSDRFPEFIGQARNEMRVGLDESSKKDVRVLLPGSIAGFQDNGLQFSRWVLYTKSVPRYKSPGAKFGPFASNFCRLKINIAYPNIHEHVVLIHIPPKRYFFRW
jgi:hypothetical protein